MAGAVAGMVGRTFLIELAEQLTVAEPAPQNSVAPLPGLHASSGRNGRSCGSWRRRAPPGPHWKEPDGIDDGITLTNRLEMPGLRGFSVKAGGNAPMRSDGSR